MVDVTGTHHHLEMNFLFYDLHHFAKISRGGMMFSNRNEIPRKNKTGGIETGEG